MIRQNLHTHTIYDDGNNTPAEMAEAALATGLTSLGFSAHSVLPFENDWALTPERLPSYLAAVREVRERFAGRLAVYSGLEWDGASSPDREGFDYIIGSLHHVAVGGEYLSVDWTPAETGRIMEQYFRGSADALAEAYYAQYGALAKDPAVDIVGHFDLLTKFSEKDARLPGATRAYRDCAMAALEPLVKAAKIIEVNTGAISRGWRTTPYPAVWLLRELKAQNARVLVSSDAHAAEAICCAFDETEALLRTLGFRERWEYAPGGFVPVAL